MAADIAELKGLHKLMHQSQQRLESAFNSHIHQPVEVVHASEGTPQAAEAATETKAEAAAAPAVPPQSPEAPPAPPVRPQRAGLFNKRSR